MAENNSIVQSVKFYDFGKNSLWLSIGHNKQWNRYSLDITRKFTYTNNGELYRSDRFWPKVTFGL